MEREVRRKEGENLIKDEDGVWSYVVLNKIAIPSFVDCLRTHGLQLDVMLTMIHYLQTEARARQQYDSMSVSFLWRWKHDSEMEGRRGL